MTAGQQREQYGEPLALRIFTNVLEKTMQTSDEDSPQYESGRIGIGGQ